MRRWAPAALVLLLAWPAHAEPPEPAFMGLGGLEVPSSRAWGVSADGTAVVGESETVSGDEAFLWTLEGGMIGLGDLSGGVFSSVGNAVSADGSVVVGTSDSGSGTEAFRWTQPGGMVGIGDLPGGGFSSEATGVSADGLVVVGDSESALPSEAFRWRLGAGMQGLGSFPGEAPLSGANAVSADGSVVVGTARIGLGEEIVVEAFRWTQAGGMTGLGDLPGGGFYSLANAVSADGSVVVGESWSESSTHEAYRWSPADGMIGLGDLPGESFFSEALDVSADGSVVVGHSGLFDDQAWRWTRESGMRSLQEILSSDLGLDLTGWTLEEATGVSDDGQIIVGNGKNPFGITEGWLAVVPVPEPSVQHSAAVVLTVLGLGAAARQRRLQRGSRSSEMATKISSAVARSR